MFIRNNLFELFILASISLLFINDYYSELAIFEYLTRTVLVYVMIVSFVLGIFTSRFIKRSDYKGNEKLPIYLSIYFFGLLLLLNVLPGGDPEAVLSFDKGIHWMFIVTIFGLEIYVFYRKEQKSKR